MKQLLPALAVCALCAVLPRATKAAVSFLNMDLNEVRELAGEKGSLYFAYFAADWCAPCRWMEEETFADRELSDYVQQRYLAVRVDIDQQDGRIHQERFQVRLLPSILIFNAQGQLLVRIETAIAAADLLATLRQHDLPKNRIGSVAPGARNNEEILDSPKPVIRMYRPPLPSEAPTNPAALPPPVMINIPEESARQEPQVPVFRPNREVMAPRSEHTFSILVANYDTYEQAVRQVGQLEAGFKEPVRLLADKGENGQQVYRIFIGLFGDKQSADNYLYYLRRKNLNGVIEEMH